MSRTRSVLLAAAVVAVLDIVYPIVLYAWILRVSTPVRVFQSVARGVLGKAAFDGGAATVILGGALHFTIAVIWTLIFVSLLALSPALRRMVRETPGAVVAGLFYGAFVWIMMQLVVIPLSQIHGRPTFTWIFWVNLVQQALMVGLPIVLLVRAPAAVTE
jgi:hypothetical protein